MKSLMEMSNQELWALFPVELREYDPEWAVRYQEERDRIIQAVGVGNVVRISHIGSTAVPGLLAKPTVDILLEIREGTPLDELVRAIEGAGYLFSPQPNNPPPHMMYLKGYTPQGFRGQVFHLHVRYPGDWDELYFRDYLRDHPETAAEYAALKQRLRSVHEHHRDNYTQGKTEFVKRVSTLGRACAEPSKKGGHA